MNETARLKKQYEEQYRKELMKELSLASIMEVPVFTKVVINVGLGEAVDDKGVFEQVSNDLMVIAGQKPIQTLSRGAISAFKIRKGDPIGLKVTLRGRRMWEFIDKLINVSLPRTKDFRGLSQKAFDGSGNYTLGIEEQTIFPEIDPNAIAKMRGMEVTIVTSTDSDASAKALLNKFGFPFIKDGEKV